MAKDRYVELKAFTFEPERNEWDASFLALVEFLGTVRLQTSVASTERNADGELITRTPEDCMARARRRLALGLMLLADTALEQLPQADQDNTVKALQSMKARAQEGEAQSAQT